MTPVNDTAAGVIGVAGGSLGLYVQVATQITSLLTAVVSLLVALGGAYLLWLRIRRARRDAKDHPLK